MSPPQKRFYLRTPPPNPQPSRNSNWASYISLKSLAFETTPIPRTFQSLLCEEYGYFLETHILAKHFFQRLNQHCGGHYEQEKKGGQSLFDISNLFKCKQLNKYELSKYKHVVFTDQKQDYENHELCKEHMGTKFRCSQSPRNWDLIPEFTYQY